MNATETIQAALSTSFDWTLQLAEDLADAPLTDPTGCQGNHPLWVMGHMAFSRGGLLAMITGEESQVAQWKELFSGGTEPSYDASKYPSYGDVLQAYRDIHQQTLVKLNEIGESGLDAKPAFVWDMLADRSDFQSKGHIFLLIAMHEMSHRGQLADARKALSRQPFV
ncbi:DinB family protein [Bremerella alba]|uniref:DinB-like domain-containing protein n=1 Tax=Bremerella alba TaxID=980252 RepID=A0A7V9A6Q1_9BACT|nr:DinB family protein [Bremerella alba]MBA2114512.1 hypothetical protein [Bremerella alba]